MTDLAFYEREGLYEPAAGNAEEIRNLLYWMEQLGWAPHEIVAATANTDLCDLAADASMRPMPELSMAEAAAQLGVTTDKLDRMRRTAGLAPRPAEGPAFARSELQAFSGIQQGSEMFSPEEADHFGRVLGSSLARIAEAAVSLFLIDVEGPTRDAGGNEFDVARLNFAASEALNGVAAAIDPLLRMHVEDAAKRSRSARPAGADVHLARLAVAFVDLVGFTPYSEAASTAQLARMVRAFEDTAYDIVGDRGGRVVKLIGDEVMFVGVERQAACETALELMAEFRSAGVTPRGGIAYGDLLARGGDYYGPIVNLASRIGDLAVPNELLATPEAAEGCLDLTVEPAGRRQLKGFDEPVELVSISG